MFVYAFDVRERIVELFEALCGARLTYNYVRPGGVAFDAPEGWTDDVLAFVTGLGAKLARDGRPVLRQHDRPRSHEGHRGAERRGRGGVGCFRPHRARFGRELGPAQARSVLGLSAHGLRRGRGRQRRCVRSRPMPPLRVLRVSAHHRAGHRPDAGRRGPDRRNTASDHATGRGRPTTTSRALAARWASTSSATARRGRTACTSAAPRSATSPCCPSSPSGTHSPTWSSSSAHSTPSSGRWTDELDASGRRLGPGCGVVDRASPRSSACGGSARSPGASSCATARKRPARPDCCRRSPTR